MHELKYMQQGYSRTPYCVCGWLGEFVQNLSHVGNVGHIIASCQKQFVAHLQSLDD